MSTKTGSFFIRAVNLKRLVSGTERLVSAARSEHDEVLLSWASGVRVLLEGTAYYVGIPDESYPTLFSWAELSLEGMEDGVTIRAEMDRAGLEQAIEGPPLGTKGRENQENVESVWSILRLLQAEEYRGKTHQVASFDPMGERLGFLP